MSVIYFLVGLPDSGQTEWAEAFERSFHTAPFGPAPIGGVVFLRPRDLIREAAREKAINPLHVVAASDPLHIEAIMIARMKAALADPGGVVVIDQPNMSARDRHRLLRHVDPEHMRVAILFHPDPALAYERLTRPSPRRVAMPWYVVDRLLQRYEPPLSEPSALHRFWYARSEFDSVAKPIPIHTVTRWQRLRFRLFQLHYRWRTRAHAR